MGNDYEDRADNGRPYIFQSTFPRGERRRVELISKRHSIISIHVPAWGTTRTLLNISGTTIFQSTFPRGERLMEDGISPDCSLFQSTFPRGERLNWNFSSRTLLYFNPRSRVGNDCFFLGHSFKLYISIHVPAWGTTIMYDRHHPDK